MNKTKTVKIESAEAIFNSLNSFEDIKRLIDGGEAENKYLECKSPGSPQLNQGLKFQLSQAISGFSNSGGGIIIFGVSTTKHAHSGLDILTQIEEIGSIKTFKQQIDLAVSTSSTPNIDLYRSKILTKKPSDTKGLVIIFIPSTSGDPIQADDGKFYLRSRDEFVEMPYETVKRMFTGSSGPDLQPIFDYRLVKLQKDGSWKIPIILENNSSAAAKDTEISVTINNIDSCDQVTGDRLIDQSEINPNKKIFMVDIGSPIYRGQNMLVGYLTFKMKKVKIAKRRLDLTIDIFSMNMRAKTYSITVQLAKKGFTVRKTKSEYLY